MLDRKMKIFVLSDDPRSPSGVGTQTNAMIQGLLETGKYSFFCFGGALRHQNYDQVKTKEYGDDLIIQPVDGYGTQESVMSVLKQYKPDALWIMTDPRQWEWLWAFEQEIRANVPIVYYHVWDNYPYPKFNRPFYLSNDKIATISKLSSDIVRVVSPEIEEQYIPHAVNADIFKTIPEESYKDLKADGKTLFFWTNRNARRKMSGSVVWWYSEFLEKVGKDKAFLLMHTDPKDPHGQDLIAIATEVGLTKDNFAIISSKVPVEQMVKFYNAADCVINISDAEGFGLSVLESLMCGTPVIGTKTGGVQDQLTDGIETFGVLINPASKAVIGSQQVPYIYEDRIAKEDFIAALEKMHNMTREERKALGKKGQDYVLKSFNYHDFVSSWDNLFTDVYEKHGSWETRKNYKSWTLKEF
jgi:glycosyltransferase involved in cell wall biosynthesis